MATSGIADMTTSQRGKATVLAKLRPKRPTVTYQHPRPTLWFVIRRTWARAIELQAWDVAATMTLYLLLTVLPRLIALTSMVSLIDFTDETIWTVAGLVNALIPAIEAPWVVATLFR